MKNLKRYKHPVINVVSIGCIANLLSASKDIIGGFSEDMASRLSGGGNLDEIIDSEEQDW